jgi:hypothetical protein
VAHPGRVRRGQRREHVQPDPGDPRGRQRPVGFEHLLQRSGRHVFHDDPGAPVALERVVDPGHAGMGQPRRGPGLAQRLPVQRVLVVGEARGQEDLLERHGPVEHLVVGFPDPAHAARAQDLAQAIPLVNGHRPGSHG